MHAHKRKIKLCKPWYNFERNMRLCKYMGIKRASLQKLTELYLNYKYKRIDKMITNRKTKLIEAKKLKSSVYKYRWRNHIKARERYRNGIFKKIFFINE